MSTPSPAQADRIFGGATQQLERKPRSDLLQDLQEDTLVIGDNLRIALPRVRLRIVKSAKNVRTPVLIQK